MIQIASKNVECEIKTNGNKIEKKNTSRSLNLQSIQPCGSLWKDCRDNCV